MDLQNLFLAFFLYTALEAILRIGVLANLAGWKYVTWKIAKPHLLMLISPGYWLARNCKLLSPLRLNRMALRARLIANYNLWNLLLTGLVFVFIMAAQNESYELLGITISLVVWRAISRSFEIAIAFGTDITTSKNASRLLNASRMKLGSVDILR